MTDDRERTRVERTLQRRFGMDQTQRDTLTNELNSKDDWFRICPDGTRRYGTPAQLKREGICG